MGRFRRATTLVDQAAILLNNSCMRTNEAQRGKPTYDPAKLTEAVGWLEHAAELAVDAETRKGIDRNREELAAMIDLMERIGGKFKPLPPSPTPKPTRITGARKTYAEIQRDKMADVMDSLGLGTTKPADFPPETESAVRIVRRWTDRVIRAGQEEYLFTLTATWRSRATGRELIDELDRQLNLLGPREMDRRRAARRNRWWYFVASLAMVVACYFWTTPAITWGAAIGAAGFAVLRGIVAVAKIAKRIVRFIESDSIVQGQR